MQKTNSSLNYFPSESTLNMEELFKYEKILLDYNMIDFTRKYK